MSSNRVDVIRTNELSIYHSSDTSERKTIIHRANISLNQGEVVAISGPSGAGKTMLSLAISGMSRFIPRIHTGGQVWWNDVDLTSISSNDYRKNFSPQIAFIWQQPKASFHPLLTIQKQWSLLLQDDAHAREGKTKLFKDTLVDLQLDDVEKVMSSLPGELSTGQLQRVNVAMAIARKPNLIISDEATASLDTDTARLVMDAISSFQKETRLTWILITHNRDQIESYADAIFRIEDSGMVTFINKEQWSNIAARSFENSYFKPQMLPKIDLNEVPILQTSQISYEYPDQAWVKREKSSRNILNRANISLRKNVFYGLAGPSGSGKSTLAKILCGDLADYHGQVFWKGIQVKKIKYHINEISNYKIQLVFQDAMLSLDPALSILEQLEEVVNHAPDEYLRMERSQLLEELLRICGLKKKDLHNLPRQYSGGQLQRIVLIRALLTNPELIIFDETFSALDEEVKSDLVHLLFELHARSPFTALIISHDISLLNRLCVQIFLLDNGQIVVADHKHSH